MASTATVSSAPSMAYGLFSSASTAADEVVTVGFTPKFVMVVIDVNAAVADPEITVGYNDALATDAAEIVNHATTQILDTVISSNIHTYTTRGFTIDATLQKDAGVNFYVCFG